MRGKTTGLLFLIGLFSVTQIRIIGSIGISEIPIFLVAPFLFITNYRVLKHDGFLPVVWLSLFTCVANCISSHLNHTPIVLAMKGFATPYSIFAVIVVLHRLLRDNLNGYKWLLVGFAFSLIVNVFVFQQSNELEAFSDGATGSIAGMRIVEGSAIFWTSRIRPFIDAFIGGWYSQIPSYVSVVLMVAFFLFSAISTASGRSMAGATLGGAVLLLIGGKKRRHMQFIKHHFVFFIVCGVLVSVFLSIGYKLAAQSGVMGEKSREKYERQMQERNGILGILRGGRAEVFIGLTACLEKPIWGHGPWPLDTNDYTKRYMERYATQAEWENYISFDQYLSMAGLTRYRMIPGHSHIISFWLNYGIVGLILWLYVLYLIIVYFRKYIDVVPQWFGYMSITTPLFLWSIFFSPYGFRVTAPLPICMILFVRATAMGRIHLPLEMQIEASKYD